MKNNIVNGLNNQELQIVQAFSSVNVPEEIFKACNMKELIHGMISDQDMVKSNTRNLDRLRDEKKDGNFITNWWDNRDDGIQDAQIDLSKSIGHLTDKSSQLLIVNTAISKFLNHQQQILLQQQNLLAEQTNELKNQNIKILNQQKVLEQQQKEINAANQGLLEAKGITQEQAQKLVGCVVRVTETEKKLELSNQELRNKVEQHNADLKQDLQMLYQAVLERINAQDAATQQLQENLAQQFETQQQDILAIVDQNSQGVYGAVAAIELNQKGFQEASVKAFEVQRDSVKLDLQHFAVDLGGQSEVLKKIDSHLLVLQESLQKSEKNKRVPLVAVACVALASLAWQIAQHFS
jgi:hypothetical protein